MTQVRDLLQRLVSIPSVNPELEPGGAGESALARFCADQLKLWGFNVDVVEVAPGRPNVVARHGTGQPRIVLNGHLDTVGVAGMSIAPFEPTIREGRMQGRGSCDMKGGVAALLEAARRVAGAPHSGTLIVALTSDEEHASAGMAALVRDGLEADSAIVCEPTELAVMPAHKGFVWIEVVFRGRAAHGSRPDEGIDAIRHAGRFLAALDEVDARLAARAPHPLLGHGSIHAGTIEGGSAPSVYPDWCRVVVERRTLPGETDDEVMSEVAALAQRVSGEVESGASRAHEAEAGTSGSGKATSPNASTTPGVDVRLLLSRPATQVDRDRPVVRGLLAAMASQGLPERVEGMSAWVDAAFLNEAGIDAVCFGPGSIAQAHSSHEWIELDQVDRCVEVLERYLGSMLGPSSG